MDNLNVNAKQIQKNEDDEELEESLPNESKSDKFKRIAERRTNTIILSIRKLQYLSNRNNYEYSDSEVKQIFTAIEEELKKVSDSFLPSIKQPNLFKFK